MEFRVLGPIEVWHDGHRLPLARRQQRLAIGILALRANTLVPRDQLIDLLWGDLAPRRARSVLQSRLSEARAVLAGVTPPDPDVHLVTRGDSYVLEVPEERVDAHAFRRAVLTWRDASSDGDARQVLRSALGLWRGSVLGDGLLDRGHEYTGTSLDALRLTAQEDLFELELRLGNERQVVDEIIEVSAANPTRERLVVQAMIALYRTNRTADALQAYDRWRRWLREELGADPGPSAQRQYLAILTGGTEGTDDDAGRPVAEGRPTVSTGLPSGDPAPAELNDFKMARPQIVPPDITDFTGRAAEYGRLRAGLTRRPDSGVSVVAITGPAGVGKTTLSVHVAHSLADEFPDGQLFADLRGVHPDEPATPMEVLAGFLRALGVDGLALPDSADDRINLFRSLLFQRRVLVVLDNAADDEQVLPLIPGSPTCAVLINSRTRLGATIGALIIDLDLLEPVDATSLLASIVGAGRVAAEPNAADRLAERCGYLPLAIRVAAAKLATKPHWKIEKIINLLDAHSPLDHLAHGRLDVRASIGLSYRGLPSDTQRLLGRLADLDVTETSIWMAAAIMDVPHEAAEDLLEQLFDARLIDLKDRDVAGDPRYRIHDLVRIFGKEQATTAEPAVDLRSARSRVFGVLLYIADALHRSLYSGDYMAVHGPAGRVPAAQHVIDAALAHPLRWFESERSTILTMVLRTADDERADVCWDLVCTASTLYPILGYHDDWQQVLDTALAVTQRVGDERGSAALLYRLGILCADRQQPDLAWEHLNRAVDLFRRTGDGHGAALVDTYMAMIDRFRGRLASAQRRYRIAIEGLVAAGDAGGEAFALRGLGQTYLDRGDYTGAEQHFERALAIYSTVGGGDRGRAQVVFWQGMLRLKQDRHEEARRQFAEVVSISRFVGDKYGEAQALRGLGICYQRLGQSSKSRSMLLEALNLVRQPRPTLVEAHVRRTLAELHPEL